jgi:hypothetical protein
MISFRILLIVIVLSLFTIHSAQAAGVVTDCTQYGPGAGTLQDALVGGGTITFTCSGTIIVLEIIISQDTTIDGTGQDVILSGNNVNRILSVDLGATLNLTHMILTNGFADEHGAIVNNGTLIITDSQITNNESLQNGALNNYGNLHVLRSTFSHNIAGYGGGGAIFNATGTPLTIVNSTFINNISEGNSGAIAASGEMGITGSTFLGNSADLMGGALFNYCGNVTLTNNTFFDNSALAGGALANLCGHFQITNDTFLSNTASRLNDAETIYNSDDSSISIVNSIVAGSADAPHCRSGDEFNGIANNLATDDSCFGFDQTTLAKLKLGLQTGAPSYFPLLPGSEAIDAGNNGLCPLTDQRGVIRPQGLGCDVGAYELLAPPASASPGRNLYTIPIVTLTWNEISWAAEYQIQLSFDPNFEVFILQDDLIPKESLSTVTPALSNGLYYWRVRAKDNANSWGKWSAVESFIVALP